METESCEKYMLEFGMLQIQRNLNWVGYVVDLTRFKKLNRQEKYNLSQDTKYKTKMNYLERFKIFIKS